MEDKNILLKWYPLKDKIKTIGHQMPDGWWYVRLPLIRNGISYLIVMLNYVNRILVLYKMFSFHKIYEVLI